MASTDAFALRHSGLNGFLFAEVGIEASGMTLSVLSTLARLGVDPWQEAERLAKLPQPAAVDGLARMIAAMPASLWSLPDATTIATRLVTLLPVHGDSSSAAPSAQRAPAASWTARQWIVLVLLAASFAGLALNLMAPQRAESDGGAAAQWSASQPVSPDVPPSGRTPTGK
jgi:hypothetical protein